MSTYFFGSRRLGIFLSVALIVLLAIGSLSIALAGGPCSCNANCDPGSCKASGDCPCYCFCDAGYARCDCGSDQFEQT
jgi:hypothetical protein